MSGRHSSNKASDMAKIGTAEFPELNFTDALEAIEAVIGAATR